MKTSTSPAPAPYRQPAEPSPGPVPVPAPPQPRPPRRWPLLALITAAALGIALWLALRTDPATKTGGGELIQPAPTAGQAITARLRIAGQTSARNFAQIMVPTFAARIPAPISR